MKTVDSVGGRFLRPADLSGRDTKRLFLQRAEQPDEPDPDERLLRLWQIEFRQSSTWRLSLAD